MKILYLSTAAIPNDWAHVIQIMKMSEAFGRCIEIEVVVPRREKMNKANVFDYYHLQKTFKITEIPCIDLSHKSPSKFVFFVRLFSFLISARLKFGNKEEVVIYTREQYVPLFFSNVVYELHALPKKIRWIHLFLWKRVTGWVVLTEQIRLLLIKNGIKPDIIKVEPDAVDLEQFDIKLSIQEARDQIGLPQNTPIIGYVGTLKTMGMEKGVGIAIQALRFLPAHYRLWVIGGEKKDIYFYENLANELNVRQRVVFQGKVDHSLVPQYIKACNIVVAPFPDHPHYRYYMSPLKIFEYMASQRAIITSNLESIREVLDSEHAILIPPGDYTKLAHAIQCLIEKPELAAVYALNSYKKIGYYTWDKRAQRIIDFIANRPKV